VIEFIDAHCDRFGIEPICAVLNQHGCGIAPSTYYAAKTRPPSARAQRDEVVLEHIRRVHGSPRIGRGVYGARKVWHELRREQARGVNRPGSDGGSVYATSSVLAGLARRYCSSNSIGDILPIE
jgi:putative transposase